MSFTALNIYISLQVIAQLFDKLDLDHDGRISFGEFLHLFQNVRPGKGDISLEAEVWVHRANLLTGATTKFHYPTIRDVFRTTSQTTGGSHLQIEITGRQFAQKCS